MTDSTRAHPLVAVVPVKDLGDAKQRLSALLGPPERQALYRAMLTDVLHALAAARGLREVLVVTRDAAAIELAQRLGMTVLSEPSNDGHTAASNRGASALAARGAPGMLQIPGDLPLLESDDIDFLIAAHRAAPAVTIAPSRDRRGSNAVASSPPDLLPLRFGEDSFYPHMDRARALGVEPQIVERDGFAFDVDTPDDLLAVLPHLRDGHTRRYLEQSGLWQELSQGARSLEPTTPAANGSAIGGFKRSGTLTKGR